MCLGVLNLVDLAGSERLKNVQTTDRHMKETQAINISLANLGNVINAMANKLRSCDGRLLENHSFDLPVPCEGSAVLIHPFGSILVAIAD